MQHTLSTVTRFVLPIINRCNFCASERSYRSLKRNKYLFVVIDVAVVAGTSTRTLVLAVTSPQYISTAKCHERIPHTSNDNTNPFRIGFRRRRGRRSSHGDRQAAGRVGLAVGRVDGEGLPMSPLRTVLQGEEVSAPPHPGRVRQTAEAQVPLLSALQQV